MEEGDTGRDRSTEGGKGSLALIADRHHVAKRGAVRQAPHNLLARGEALSDRVCIQGRQGKEACTPHALCKQRSRAPTKAKRARARRSASRHRTVDPLGSRFLGGRKKSVRSCDPTIQENDLTFWFLPVFFPFYVDRALDTPRSACAERTAWRS